MLTKSDKRRQGRHFMVKLTWQHARASVLRPLILADKSNCGCRKGSESNAILRRPYLIYSQKSTPKDYLSKQNSMAYCFLFTRSQSALFFLFALIKRTPSPLGGYARRSLCPEVPLWNSRWQGKGRRRYDPTLSPRHYTVLRRSTSHFPGYIRLAIFGPIGALAIKEGPSRV